jgi:cytochrome c-type biogenesis protein CcmH/NrfG
MDPATPSQENNRQKDKIVMGGVIFSLIVMAVMVIFIMAVVMRGTGVLPLGRQGTLVVLPMLAGIVIYGMIGSLEFSDQPLSLRAEELQIKAEIEASRREIAAERLAAAEAQVMANPGDIMAMLTLAEAAAAAEEYDIEIAALEAVVKLTDNNTVRAMLAEAMTRQAGGIVTEAAAELLRKTMAENPEDWRAPYLYALYASQNGNDDQAIFIWQDLARRVKSSENGQQMLNLINIQLKDMARKTGRDEADVIITP